MIVIVDYGMGNLRSVQKAFERVGHAATVTDDPTAISRAEKIILPGVGAFKDAMDGLAQRNLIGPIKEVVTSGKPYLGICLGLQLLFTTGYEDGEHAGLDIIPGRVVRFQPLAPRPSPPVPSFKIPQMGWNKIEIVRPAPPLKGIASGTFFYFAHSYYVVPDDAKVTASETEYGVRFASAVWRKNVFATQFHPEKSQKYGLLLLKNFAEG
jgi:glutamine amidotransferase